MLRVSQSLRLRALMFLVVIRARLSCLSVSSSLSSNTSEGRVLPNPTNTELNTDNNNKKKFSAVIYVQQQQ